MAASVAAFVAQYPVRTGFRISGGFGYRVFCIVIFFTLSEARSSS